MRKLFTEPTMDIKSFSAESIVTNSYEGQPDTVENANKADTVITVDTTKDILFFNK